MSDWKFEVDEVGEEAETGAEGEREPVPGGADPFDDPEPGSPSTENAAFVLLGMAFAVAVFASMLL